MNEWSNDEISAFDLPQLYQRPSFRILQQTLDSLRILPGSFDIAHPDTGNSTGRTGESNNSGIATYLTNLISSSLAWLEPETERDIVRDQASKRLTERAGRTATAGFERRFKFDVSAIDGDTYALQFGCKDVEIVLREPSLTGDDLGHKTWLGAYVLAKKLFCYIPRLCRSSWPIDPAEQQQQHQQSLRILELGAGTGLAGLAAAAAADMSVADDCKKTIVHLTDLPAIVPNLQYNVAANSSLFEKATSIEAFALDWADIATLDDKTLQSYDIILAADSLYAAEHTGLLTEAMRVLLRRRPQSAIYISLPFRQMDQDYHTQLSEAMTKNGFIRIEEGHESGLEDWYDQGQRPEVICWWSIWAWRTSGAPDTDTYG